MTRFVTGSDGFKTNFIQHGTNAFVLISIASTPLAGVFGPSTQLIRVISDVQCHIAFGVAPVATVNDPLLPAKTLEYIGVKPGEKIATLEVGGVPGFLSVTEAA